jgi:hypothetical protein
MIKMSADAAVSKVVKASVNKSVLLHTIFQMTQILLKWHKDNITGVSRIT